MGEGSLSAGAGKGERVTPTWGVQVTHEYPLNADTEAVGPSRSLAVRCSLWVGLN